MRLEKRSRGMSDVKAEEKDTYQTLNIIKHKRHLLEMRHRREVIRDRVEAVAVCGDAGGLFVKRFVSTLPFLRFVFPPPTAHQHHHTQPDADRQKEAKSDSPPTSRRSSSAPR